MTRTIKMIYRDIEEVVHADLRDDFNPEACSIFWDNLPYESVQSHFLAAGDGMFSPHRIVSSVKTQTEVMTRAREGTIWLSMMAYKILAIKVGEMNEPLPITSIAQVREEDMPVLERVARAAFDATFTTHFPLHVRYERA